MHDLTPRWPKWVLVGWSPPCCYRCWLPFYSISTRWGDPAAGRLYPRLVPQTVGDPRFLAAFGRLLVCFATLLLGTLVLVPTVLVVAYYFPGWIPDEPADPAPFAVPPVVSSVGLLQIYADGVLPIIGTPWILIGTWFTVVLPFMYRALANSLQVPLKDLMDAAHLLGQAVARLPAGGDPRLRKGLLAALFLSLSFLLGEFVFANMLVGTRYETLQVYLYNMRATSGHFTSALVMSYFLLTLLLTWAANRFHR